MTLQEIFNQVYLGLKSQGFQRSVSSRGCAYRNNGGGRKCAVGHLILDEEYNPVFEGKSFCNIPSHLLSDRLKKIQTDFEEHLIYVQWIHDRSRSPAKMKEDLHWFAQNNSLTIPEFPQQV